MPQENEAPPASTPAPLSTPAFDPRRRIRELLAIPDRDRNDAEWDELNELEIQTAPGNRASGQPFAAYNPGKPAGGAPAGKNRFKGKQRKPGVGPRPPQQAKQNKPRPA